MSELIERKQAGKNICKYCASNAYCKEDDCMVYRGLRDTPTVQIKAEQMRHGRWEQIENGEYYCTNCGREEKHIFQKNYCPRCGADMR